MCNGKDFDAILAELLAVDPNDESTWTAAMREAAKSDMDRCCIGESQYKQGPAGDVQLQREILYEALRQSTLGLYTWLQTVTQTLMTEARANGNTERARVLGKLSDRILDLVVKLNDLSLLAVPKLLQMYSPPDAMVQGLRGYLHEQARAEAA
jgi:hypothetical protein